MIDKLNYILECYNNFRVGYPWWVTMIFAVLHIITVIVCIAMNNHDKSTERVSKSHNSLHCSFWVIMILGFPVIGILLYILFSFIPYKIWNKKAKDRRAFPLAFKISKASWILYTLSGVAGVISGAVVKESVSGSAGTFLTYAVPLSSWIISTVFNLNKNYLGKYLFISLHDSDKPTSDMTEEKRIFGNLHFAEEDTKKEPEIFGVESLLARKAADSIISDGIMPVKSPSDFFSSTGRVSGYDKNGNTIDKNYKYHGNNRDFETSVSDVYEVKYIGRGVTRYVMAFWSEDDNGNLKCIDRVRYRVSLPLKFVLMRSFILLFIVWALFSSNAGDIICNIVTFINNIIGG
ncbi:MAG: hypothetical protein NC177_12350 [Ruminococcus flavefaciens]|nr:hypothetical protein [Ruminococcus flavefaciens]